MRSSRVESSSGLKALLKAWISAPPNQASSSAESSRRSSVSVTSSPGHHQRTMGRNFLGGVRKFARRSFVVAEMLLVRARSLRALAARRALWRKDLRLSGMVTIVRYRSLGVEKQRQKQRRSESVLSFEFSVVS